MATIITGKEDEPEGGYAPEDYPIEVHKTEEEMKDYDERELEFLREWDLLDPEPCRFVIEGDIEEAIEELEYSWDSLRGDKASISLERLRSGKLEPWPNPSKAFCEDLLALEGLEGEFWRLGFSVYLVDELSFWSGSDCFGESVPFTLNRYGFPEASLDVIISDAHFMSVDGYAREHIVDFLRDHSSDPSIPSVEQYHALTGVSTCGLTMENSYAPLTPYGEKTKEDALAGLRVTLGLLRYYGLSQFWNLPFRRVSDLKDSHLRSKV